jgi:hypothetical protein
LGAFFLSFSPEMSFSLSSSSPLPLRLVQPPPLPSLSLAFSCFSSFFPHNSFSIVPQPLCRSSSIPLPCRHCLAAFHPQLPCCSQAFSGSQIRFSKGQSAAIRSSEEPTRLTTLFIGLPAFCRCHHCLVLATTRCHVVIMHLRMDLTFWRVHLTRCRVSLTRCRVSSKLLLDSPLPVLLCPVLRSSCCSVRIFTIFFPMYFYFPCILQLFLFFAACLLCVLLSHSSLAIRSFSGDFCNWISVGPSLYFGPDFGV